MTEPGGAGPGPSLAGGSLGASLAARAKVLAKIRGGLSRGALSADAARALESRIEQARPNLVPAIGQLGGEARISGFLERIRANAMTADQIPSADAVPEAVCRYLASPAGAPLSGGDPPRALKVARALAELPWKAAGLDVEIGTGEVGDRISVVPAFAAIAETGTLVGAATSTTPMALYFTPESNIVVLGEDRVMGSLEGVWQAVRARFGPRRMPRALSLISSTSSCGDIDRFVRGAHGPRRVHVILCPTLEGAGG